MIRFISICCSLALLATQASSTKYELLAKELISDDEIIKASGDVVIYSKKNIFRADRAIYNPKSGDLELLGDVYLSYNNKESILLKYTKFNLKNSTFSSKNIFAYDEDSSIWFDTLNTKKEGEIYKLKHTTLSSCNRIDPAWKIGFTKGFYNKKREYISLYNPTFYADGIPILYLPWFGFPTNRDRSSGFLKPILGYEDSENIFLVTPYFIANQKNWDIELDPQIRLKRGVGLYSTLRFVDTASSKGSFTLGYFKDNLSYQKRHDLKNRSHYGGVIKYRSDLLLGDKINSTFKKDFQDGALIDAIYLNDIDFINLNHTMGYASSKLATSRFNYVLHNNRDFFGVYAKYFIDTEKKSNADTIQTLPSIQYHRYTNTFFVDNILYSLDYKFIRNYRRDGLNANQHEFSLPITFYKGFFNEYINFQASENFYYSRVNYSNRDNIDVKNANYFSNYHKFLLSSDLTKRYDNFTHNIQSEVSFVIPSVNNKSGYFAPFIPFNLERKSISLKLNQYLYDSSGFNFLYHRFIQKFYDSDTIYKYGDSENQIIFYPKKYLKLHNTLFYSHQYNRIRKIQSGLSYNKDRYRFKINHTYEYKKYDKNSDFITASFDSKIDSNYDLFGRLDYDLEDSFTKEWSLGWRMKKKCWEYMFRYKESVTPNLTSEGAHSMVKRGVLFYVTFHPLGGVKYEYSKRIDLDSSILTNLAESQKE